MFVSYRKTEVCMYWNLWYQNIPGKKSGNEPTPLKIISFYTSFDSTQTF